MNATTRRSIGKVEKQNSYLIELQVAARGVPYRQEKGELVRQGDSDNSSHYCNEAQHNSFLGLAPQKGPYSVPKITGHLNRVK
jgi:hypothetical protein